MFKVGDIVEITEESSAMGMLDFIDGKGYTVKAVYDTTNAVMLLNESLVARWYHYAHFKLKEVANKGDNVEKKECLFKEGQKVHCVLGGEGVVSYIKPQSAYPVKVYFTNGEVRDYTKDGRLYEWDINRALFFSPTVVTGATEPLFEPVLKENDVVYAVHIAGSGGVFSIAKELEHEVKTHCGEILVKTVWDFYRMGEKIEFN